MNISKREFQIVDARVRVLTAPVSDGTAMSFSTLSRRAMVILELETQNGLVGVGESWVNFPEWAPIERVATIAQGVLPLLMNEDSRRINYLHQLMITKLTPIGRQWGAPGPIMQAISAADIALWDLWGRSQGKSIAELAGGRQREAIDIYASSLGPTGINEQGLYCKSRGYTAVKVKLGFGRTNDEQSLSTAMETCGETTILYADANQAWSLKQAIEMAPVLHSYNVAWIEEPLRGNDLTELETLNRKTGLSIATGENLTCYEEFIPYICSEAIGIIQPDLTKAGGLSEVFSICKLAESRGKSVIPHFYGGAIGFAATLQLAASMSSVSSIEYDIRDNPLRDSLLINPPIPINGVIPIPNGPGLGIDLDTEAISLYLKETT